MRATTLVPGPVNATTRAVGIDAPAGAVRRRPVQRSHGTPAGAR